MAVSASSSLNVSPLHTTSSASLASYSKLHFFSISLKPPPTFKQRHLIISAQKSESGLSSEKKREFLERYGLNPDEYLTDESPKARRKKVADETKRGKKVAAADNSPQRTTHKLLQVLGGTARRKKLLSPKSQDVRPMMEVVKGAVFSILQSAGGNPASLRPGRWLDLYSGTGSVGIEAISRGCSEAHFVELDPWVVSDVLRPNLESTGFLEAAVIHTVRVEDFLERADQMSGNKNEPFEYISVTPPYMLVDYAVLMNQIAKSSLIGDDSFVVVEYPLKTDMLDSCGCLVKIADRRFGRTNLLIYGPKWAEKKRKSN